MQQKKRKQSKSGRTGKEDQETKMGQPIYHDIGKKQSEEIKDNDPYFIEDTEGER